MFVNFLIYSLKSQGKLHWCLGILVLKVNARSVLRKKIPLLCPKQLSGDLSMILFQKVSDIINLVAKDMSKCF